MKSLGSMSMELFDKNAGVQMVWIFDGHRVSCRKKADVDRDLNGRYGSMYRSNKYFFNTEVEARKVEVDAATKRLEDAERAVKVADRALTRAEARLNQALKEARSEIGRD